MHYVNTQITEISCHTYSNVSLYILVSASMLVYLESDYWIE